MKPVILIVFWIFFAFNSFAQKEIIGLFGKPNDCWNPYSYSLYADSTFKYSAGGTFGSGTYSMKKDTVFLTFSGEEPTIVEKKDFKIEYIPEEEIQVEVREVFSKKAIENYELIYQIDDGVSDTIKSDTSGICHLGKIFDLQNKKRSCILNMKGTTNFIHFHPATYAEIQTFTELFQLKFSVTRPFGIKFIVYFERKKREKYYPFIVPANLHGKVLIYEKSDKLWKAVHLEGGGLIFGAAKLIKE